MFYDAMLQIGREKTKPIKLVDHVTMKNKKHFKGGVFIADNDKLQTCLETFE